MIVKSRDVFWASGLCLALAGCEPTVNEDGTQSESVFGGLFKGKPETEAEQSADGVVTYTGEARDLEAPDIFQVTAQGLWDGRPSLGGAWVAHPDVKDPERVRIVNESNGKTITAALFRRERENPGPVFQLSSDAAAELSVVPGRPVSLKVTALQKAPEPEPVPIPAPAEGEIPDPETTTDAPAAPPAADAPTTAPPAEGDIQASILPEEIEQNTIDTVAAAEAALARDDAAIREALTRDPAADPDTVGDP